MFLIMQSSEKLCWSARLRSHNAFQPLREAQDQARYSPALKTVCARRVTAKGPRLFDAFAYNMYNVDGQRAMAVAVSTLAGLRRDTGAAVPVSVGEYAAFSAR
jgi:hypothetical protein